MEASRSSCGDRFGAARAARCGASFGSTGTGGWIAALGGCGGASEGIVVVEARESNRAVRAAAAMGQRRDSAAMRGVNDSTLCQT